jgi:hypothetical protein
MPTPPVDHDHLQVTGAHRAANEPGNVRIEDDVFVIVTQAFGPTGESLVGISDVTFDGYPAVTLLVKAGDREGLVHMSPFHGDRRKAGFVDIEPGTKCELFCPVSRKRLDFVGRVDGDSPADYYAIYLTPRLSKGEMVAISDIWGDYHSRIVDNFELISSWDGERDA